jgi:hypothetical protein
VTHTAAIFSFSADLEGTSPAFSGMMASDFHFTPNVSTVENSSPMAFVKPFTHTASVADRRFLLA